MGDTWNQPDQPDSPPHTSKWPMGGIVFTSIGGLDPTIQNQSRKVKLHISRKVDPRDPFFPSSVIRQVEVGVSDIDERPSKSASANAVWMLLWVRSIIFRTQIRGEKYSRDRKCDTDTYPGHSW